MTPAARLAAAVEVLDLVAASRAPADEVLKAWGRRHRFAGSGDRRAIGERVWLCLRERGRFGGGDGRALVAASLVLHDALTPEAVDDLFSGQGHAPAPLTEAERARLLELLGGPVEALGLPDFLEAELRRAFGDDWAAEARVLLKGRAPLDLRVNGGSREAVAAELKADGLEFAPTPWSAWGLRLVGSRSPDISKLTAFRQGRIEVQDEGSQLVSWLPGARPGERVVDYCAGGGGKTLALAQALGSDADLIACDIDAGRLDAIRPRLERAGASADLRLLGPDGEGTDDLAGTADLVFVDAPCSGSGIWRRHPEAAWRLTPEDLERFHALQVQVLTQSARLVRPGGRLVYVTCSVLPRENTDSADAFVNAHPDFRPTPIADGVATPNLTDAARARLAELAPSGHTLQLTPARTQTDGFFVATFTRAA